MLENNVGGNVEAAATRPILSYQKLSIGDETAQYDDTILANPTNARKTESNFVLMSVLFSANHGCFNACLALAASRLGETGAWQSSILYISYTLSSLMGTTYLVKRLGARNALFLGMGLYCAYVGCFWVTKGLENDHRRVVAAYTGAGLGGMGASILWTAQGGYFSLAAKEHAKWVDQPLGESTASLAGIFAFLYLGGEVFLTLASSILVARTVSWETIFFIFTVIAVVSTLLFPMVIKDYPRDLEDYEVEDLGSVFHKVTAASQLLWNDPKMKYMIGFNATFGFTAAFLNSYVSGQVVPKALDDPHSEYIGLFVSWVGIVAATASLIFRKGKTNQKESILIFGATCFFGVVFPFVIQPNPERYGWFVLLLVYTLHGIGRATFEGTLKATFADYFPHEPEGAFANIILQNGLAGAIGYILTFVLLCKQPARYCIEYTNGTLHNVFLFEFIVVISAILAVWGLIRASALFYAECL